jgi:aspartate kinase
MRVFKFGGASVKNAESIKNVAGIIEKYGKNDSLVVVVSAMGKTTNQLEEVVSQKFINIQNALSSLKVIYNAHLDIVKQLFPEDNKELLQQIHEHFVEAEWVIEEQREMHYDYVYDQIVCVGELVSSRILGAWLLKTGLDVSWIDARSIILTDDTYRDGRIQWDETEAKIKSAVNPLFDQSKIVLTQGFIASTKENNSTTLGREGSDFTAAILANTLNAEAMYIWKDVPGVLTGDPDLFINVTKLDRLSYSEAIEMTYYGCKVIHPKTIQPLKLKNIPLYVKSFIDPEGEGTLISVDIDIEYPPIVIMEANQSLIHFTPKDLTFIAEHHLAHIFNLFEQFRIKVNMMRNTAISFSVCVRNESDRIQELVKSIEKDYKVMIDNDLELLTIRHYQESMIPKLLEDKIVILDERTRKTVQLVVKNAPPIMMKSK